MTDAIFVHGLPMHRFTTEENDQRHFRSQRPAQSRINIGNQMDRWLVLKSILGFWKNEEVAKMLMDSWSSINGIYLDTSTVLAEKDGSSASEEEEELSIEDECEDLPILERQLEDWEVSSKLKITVPYNTKSSSAALQPNFRSSTFLQNLMQTAHQAQNPQAQTLPQMKMIKVQNSQEIQKSQQVQQIPQNQQLPSLQTQNAAPNQQGTNVHWMFFPNKGGKPLLVLPNTCLGPKSVIKDETKVLSTVTDVLTSTKASVSSSTTSPGKCLPMMSSNHVGQNSNFEQKADSDCDITQIKIVDIRSGSLSEEEFSNKVTSTDQVEGGDQVLSSNSTSGVEGADQALSRNSTSGVEGADQALSRNSTSGVEGADQALSSNSTSGVEGADQALSRNSTSGVETDDVVLNMYCSSGDDADDDDDDHNGDDKKYRTHILKPSSVLNTNKIAKKRKGSKLGDAVRTEVSASPKKLDLEPSDTSKCFRSERLRKRGRISFVELLKGNVVFEKGKNGKIFAKERETSVKNTSPGKVNLAKERNSSVNSSTKASTGSKTHNRKNKSNSSDSGVTKDNGSCSDTDSAEDRYSDSDSDFDPHHDNGMSTNGGLKSLKRKSQSASDHSGEEHNLTTAKKIKISDRVVCFGGS